MNLVEPTPSCRLSMHFFTSKFLSRILPTFYTRNASLIIAIFVSSLQTERTWPILSCRRFSCIRLQINPSHLYGNMDILQWRSVVLYLRRCSCSHRALQQLIFVAPKDGPTGEVLNTKVSRAIESSATFFVWTFYSLFYGVARKNKW